MKQSIEESILTCAITLVLAVSVSAQVQTDDGKGDKLKKSSIINIAVKKKGSVKVEYHKFEDMTCASVSLGQIPLTSFWDRAISGGALFVDAVYCSAGKTLNPPAIISLNFQTRNSTTTEPSIIFLLDTTDRLTLEGRYKYAGGMMQSTFLMNPEKVLTLTKAKTVEFQIFGFAYKFSQKNLSKLKDLVESGGAAQ